MTPIFIDVKGNKIFHENCFDAFQEVENESIDLIFADPPYFLSSGGITCKSGKMESVNKGNWDASTDLKSIHDFNKRWLEECKKKLKPNGTIFVSGTLHNIYSVGFALQELSYKIINDISWFKVNPPPNLSCRYFTHATETILWAKKSYKAKHYFNYDLMKEIGDPSPGKQMLSLWKITPPKLAEKKFGKHPTQKPLALLNRIILSASKEGDTILDPFLGSGTTAEAAISNNRRFIGFELDKNYVDIAIARAESSLFEVE